MTSLIPASPESADGNVGTQSEPVQQFATEIPLFRCSRKDCGATLRKCHNYAVEDVCNRCMLVDDADGVALCDYCSFSETIPDLSIDGNRQRWYQLEIAKRRLLYSLDMLGLPYGTAADGFWFPLSFDFKADAIPAVGIWRTMGNEERVFTGHLAGKITINLREADDVERERLRVDLQEAHRTLIGHFRHEIGHYFWHVLVENQREPKFIQLFGDHRSCDYDQALQQYYDQGPPVGWQDNYISAYSTLHPWEDFAETFACYLDLVSVIDTAGQMELTQLTYQSEFSQVLDYYRHLGMVLNEINRSMGLKDVIPEIISAQVADKLRFISQLVQGASAKT